MLLPTAELESRLGFDAVALTLQLLAAWQPLHDWLDRCGSSHSARSE
jgi:hypothetical protein